GDDERPVDVVVKPSLEHSGPHQPIEGSRFGFSTGLGGSGFLSFFAKNVSRIWWTTSAALPPWTPCSRNTTPAICGSSFGAKNTNQPLSRRSFSVLPAAALP